MKITVIAARPTPPLLMGELDYACENRDILVLDEDESDDDDEDSDDDEDEDDLEDDEEEDEDE